MFRPTGQSALGSLGCREIVSPGGSTARSTSRSVIRPAGTLSRQPPPIPPWDSTIPASRSRPSRADAHGIRVDAPGDVFRGLGLVRRQREQGQDVDADGELGTEHRLSDSQP